MSEGEFHPIVIVGAGFSGLGMGIRLKKAGISNFIILERAMDVGGVWRENTYPGCACDVESHLYSYSFAPNAKWSHLFSSQNEIWRYLQNCARHFGLIENIRFDHELKRAEWDEAQNRWRLETSQGKITAEKLILATGALNQPYIPDLGNFKGEWFHSSRWDDSISLKGKRVAVIGTGASAIQFVPRIQPEVEKLFLFQRTPPWILPRRDYEISERMKRLFNWVPCFLKLWRWRLYWLRETYGIAFRHPKEMEKGRKVAVRHLHRQIKDPKLREQLTPGYTMGCKRILLSDDYYPALTQPNVEVIHGAWGEKKRDVDVIILGTGFRVTEFPFSKYIFGKEGKSLFEVWQGSAKAYRGTVIAGFPNLFGLLGPNTGLGHNSVLLMLEGQLRMVMKLLKYRRIEVKAEAQEQYTAQLDRQSKSTVWLSGCKSWYLDKAGRNSTLWPLSVTRYLWRMHFLRKKDFVIN